MAMDFLGLAIVPYWKSCVEPTLSPSLFSLFLSSFQSIINRLGDLESVFSCWVGNVCRESRHCVVPCKIHHRLRFAYIPIRICLPFSHRSILPYMLISSRLLPNTLWAVHNSSQSVSHNVKKKECQREDASKIIDNVADHMNCISRTIFVYRLGGVCLLR